MVLQGAVQLGRETAAGLGITNVTFQVADGQDLSSFRDASFDVVCCSSAIFYMADPYL